MKKRLTLLTLLFVLAAGCSAARQAISQSRKPESSPAPAAPEESAKSGAVMKELRQKLLTSKPEDVGLGGTEAKVWGVLMDVAFPSGVATLVSLRDGTASLYTTTGGGILGGYVAQAEAKAFVEAAEKHLAHTSPAEAFPYPAAGRVKFYVLTRDGVRTAEAPLDDLGDGRHKLSPLYNSADQVLTQLRLASEKQKE